MAYTAAVSGRCWNEPFVLCRERRHTAPAFLVDATRPILDPTSAPAFPWRTCSLGNHADPGPFSLTAARDG
jgi:hypothetical protein